MRWYVCLMTLLVAAATAVGAETAEGAHGDTGSPTVFAGTFAQSIAAAVVFLTLVAILWKFAWGPILEGLQDRERKIGEDLAEAEQANKDAKQTLAEYEAKLREAHAEARQLLEQTRKDADELREKLSQETQDELARQRQQAMQEIDTARRQALQDLYAQAATLATAVAGKLLERQIDDSDAQRLVEQSLAEMDQLKAG
jgi:F-type H+-transporting ATPase subunit b